MRVSASLVARWAMGCLLVTGGCATGPSTEPVRDPTAPFQTATLHYQFDELPGELRLLVTARVVNTRSRPIRSDACHAELQRRDRGQWATVYLPICPQADGLAGDSIPPGSEGQFVFSLRACTLPNCLPALTEPVDGVYRILFGLAERLNPSVDLVVWQAVGDVSSRRSNEFRAARRQ